MSVFNRKEGKKLIKDQLRKIANRDSKDNNRKKSLKVQLSNVQSLFRSVLQNDKPLDEFDTLCDYINEYRSSVNLNQLNKLDKLEKTRIIAQYVEKEPIDASTLGVLFLKLMENDEFVKMANNPCDAIEVHRRLRNDKTKFVISFVKNGDKLEETQGRYVFVCYTKDNSGFKATEATNPII